MYHAITSEEAMTLLKQDILNNAMNIDTLQYMMEHDSAAACYLHDDTLIMADMEKGKHHIYVCPLSDSFDAEKTKTFICSRFAVESICVDIQNLPNDIVNGIREHFGRIVPFKRMMKDFVYTKSPEARMCEHVLELTSEDKEMFVAAPDFRVMPGRPPMPILFQVFVERNAGTILAYVENGIMKGYLSYQNIWGSVYNVDYICVAEPYRNRGIGKKLGQAYLHHVNNKHGLAVWSNAKTQESERLALRIGFIPGRHSLIFMQ